MVTFPGVSPGDPIRIWVNGQEFTSEIVSMSIESNFGMETPPQTEIRVSVSGMSTAPPTPSPTPSPSPTPERHNFEQDPAEEATLCRDCGMWPEHHNHSGMNGPWGACVCQECVTNAHELRG